MPSHEPLQFTLCAAFTDFWVAPFGDRSGFYVIQMRGSTSYSASRKSGSADIAVPVIAAHRSAQSFEEARHLCQVHFDLMGT